MTTRQGTKLRIGGAVLAAVLMAAAAVAVVQAQGVSYVLKVVLNAACTIQSGAGSPNSSITGSVCDVFLRTDGGAATTFYVKESGTATNTGWVAVGGAHLEKITIPAAFCDHGTATSVWSTSSGGAGSPNDTCDIGTNVVFGDLAYLDSGTQSAQFWIQLPADWTSTIDLTITWYTTATTGNVRFELSTACASVGDTLDPSWNTAQALVDAAQGVAGRMNTVSQTGVTTTGCVAGDLMFVRILRDPANAGDTIAATADVVAADILLRRTF